MQRWLAAITISVLCCGTSACVGTSVYRNWGEQLANLPLHNGRLEDVSMILGTSPSRCELVNNPPPMIGIYFGHAEDQPVVKGTRPKGPANRAGIQLGDTIKSIAGQSVSTVSQALFTLKNCREGQAVEIETNRGILSVIPEIPKYEQCYWEVQAGQVAQTGGFASANRYGGTAYSGGSAYQRFFRATCRLVEGYVAACQANWQE